MFLGKKTKRNKLTKFIEYAIFNVNIRVADKDLTSSGNKGSKIMTRQEKMKYYRRRQIALIIGVVLVLGALIAAVVLLLSGDDEVSENTPSVSSESITDDLAADKAIENEDLRFEFAVDEITIEVEEEYKAHLINETGDVSVTWESSNTSVAVVDNGRIIGVGEGSCDITAQIESLGLSARMRVYVEKGGPEIVERDGITYVDGILIANKSYSLPSDYAPDFLPETQAAFDEMEADASVLGLELYISSGFRSYEYQSQIYNNYVARDGQAEADTYSARPGHSEHQTGLALDLNTIDISFENTAEYEWLRENAHKYGFIIRYPEGKEHITGYQYEPWHLRYLGKEIAEDVYESGLCLEEYLGIDSVYAD